jgi:glycosyltransferase involved in cell wall biosynthesis
MISPSPARPLPIRVGFTFSTHDNSWHGGRNYYRSLFLALNAIPDAGVQPVAFIGTRADAASFEFPSNVEVVRLRVFDRLSPAWALNKLAMKILGRPSVVNAMLRHHDVQIVSHGAPTKTTAIGSIGWIPDFQHVHLPQYFPRAEMESRTALYRDYLARCDRVIVSSESARRDLAQFSATFIGKARVLRFCALRPQLDNSVDVREAHDLGDGPFFYIPNQCWAHKNHLTAIRALAALRVEYPDVKIVCTGGLVDYRNPDHLRVLRDEIDRHGLASHFLLLDVVPYPHIAQLMVQAVAVINPSLFEGWSTTVEEGKALGVPLILSSIDVHHEQCPSGGASFFQPLDPGALADAMRIALQARQGGASGLETEEALQRHHQRLVAVARAYGNIVADLAAEMGIR